MSEKTEQSVINEAITGELKTIDTPGGKVLTFLTGPAPAEILPEKISLSGDIKTVGNFLKVRNQVAIGNQIVEAGKAVVIVDKEKLTIDLLLNPESFYGTKVKGTLELAPELEQFCINKNKMFNKDEFVKLLKFNKLFFPDVAKHAQMVKEFMKVTSSVSIKSSDSSDERGNKMREFVKEVETNAPTDFALDIPIFKGFPNEKFKVNICVDAPEGSLRFWLESVELHELMQVRVDQIFEDELKAADGFVIVNK